MDREISKNEQLKAKSRQIIISFFVISLVIAALFFSRKFIRKTAKASEIYITKVERGNIRSTLMASGIIVASSERVINSPVSTEIQDVLLISGSKVESGDLILKLDKEYTSLEYERLDDELELRKNNISRLGLEFDKDLKDLAYSNEIKALQLDRLKSELSDRQRLLKVGGATPEQVKAAKLELQIAEIEKNQLENELSFKRSVNSTDKENLQLEYNIQKKRLRELARKLKETEVRSPQSGVITWLNDDIGKTVTEGEPLVKIANLTRFEIEATTSDRNSKELMVGLPVEVRIGKERLKGNIDRILPEIVNNTVRFYIALEEPDNEQLRPSLRTEILVIKDEKSNVLRAKRGNILKGTKSQFVYKVNGGTAEKVRIKKGLISSEYFEILDGLQEGDELIISDTEEFEHMDKFDIKSK